MNKNLKKFICIVLSLIIAASCFSVISFADNEYEEEPIENTESTFLGLFVQTIRTIIDFFRYILFDVWAGVDAGPIPDAPTSK